MHFIQSSKHLFIGIHERGMKLQALNHMDKTKDMSYKINGGGCMVGENKEVSVT